MIFSGLPKKLSYEDDEYLFYLMASCMVGFALFIKLTKQEVYRFAGTVVSSVIGLFLFIKLHTEKEASALTFTFAVCGFVELINLTRKEVWRFALSIASAIVGLLFYALSSLFNDLFGKWNALKIILYMVFSLIVLFVVWFAKQVSFLGQHRGVRVTFLVWASTTVYSFYSDKASKGTPDAYSVVSCFAFAIMSFCCGFEELLYFFCGVLTAQLMKTKMLLGVMGISFSYFLIATDSNLIDELKLLALPPPKQELWRLLGFASTIITSLSTALSLPDHLIFDSLKILICGASIPMLSGLLLTLLSISRQSYSSIIHIKAHTTIIMIVWTVESVLYPFLLDDIKNGDVYKLVSWGSLAVMQHAIPMPTIYRICCFYVFTHVFFVKLMGINSLLSSLATAFALFHVLFDIYLDYNNKPPPQNLGTVEEASAHSTGEDQPQVVSSAVASPQASHEDQPPQIVIEEASPQSTATA
ncbi:hypothetical protein HN51_000198 [Arachis hypogaea]|nr:uncharacterized protein DS421_1g01990 [Arachis hypogaea]